MKNVLEEPEPEVEREKIDEKCKNILHGGKRRIEIVYYAYMYILCDSLQANCIRVEIKVYTDGSSLGNP